jgi:hypothetical protein
VLFRHYALLMSYASVLLLLRRKLIRVGLGWVCCSVTSFGSFRINNGVIRKIQFIRIEAIVRVLV